MGDTGLVPPDSGGAAGLLYVAVALALALYLSRKTDRFWWSFILMFWVLGEPVLRAFYTIRPGWLPFDFQPNRILFILLVAALPLVHIAGQGRVLARTERKLPDFEKYILILILFVILSQLINFTALETKRVIATSLELMTFYVIYLFTRKTITEKLLGMLLYAVVAMAVVNSVVAFVQLADPLFLRTGELRHAFGGIYRSYGTFVSEYVFGSFQVVAFFVAMVTIRIVFIRYVLLGIIALSVFVTFHRMDMIIFLVCLMLYLAKYASRRAAFFGNAAIIVALVILVPGYAVYKSISGESRLVTERLAKDTVSGRFDQFSLVISNMPKYPLGLGSEDNRVYQEMMIRRGHTKSVLGTDGRFYDVGLPVHNGFLAVGIIYGIPAMFIFTVMLWKMWRYFYVRANSSQKITVIPLFSVLVWVLANLSNGVIVFRSYNVLVVALLLGAFVGAYRKGIIGSSTSSPVH